MCFKGQNLGVEGSTDFRGELLESPAPPLVVVHHDDGGGFAAPNQD